MFLAQYAAAKWERCQDVYTDVYFWRHLETGEVTYEQPGIEHYLPSGFEIPPLGAPSPLLFDPTSPFDPDFHATGRPSSSIDISSESTLFIGGGGNEGSTSERLHDEGVSPVDEDATITIDRVQSNFEESSVVLTSSSHGPSHGLQDESSLSLLHWSADTGYTVEQPSSLNPNPTKVSFFYGPDSLRPKMLHPVNVVFPPLSQAVTLPTIEASRCGMSHYSSSSSTSDQKTGLILPSLNKTSLGNSFIAAKFTISII